MSVLENDPGSDAAADGGPFGVARLTPCARESARLAAALALVAAAFGSLAAWSWRAWPDPLVDFGAELYRAWRLASGDVLYRDLAHYSGPLSQGWNGLLFELFGASLGVLVAANLTLLAALTLAVFFVVRRPLGLAAATTAALVLLAVFGFAHLSRTGNYDWVCPYSHEATHGVALGILALVLAAPGRATGRARPLAAGVAVGLAFLTKPETFLAAAGGLACALALAPGDRRARARTAGLAALGLALALGLAFAVLARSRPAPEAARAVVAAFPALASAAPELPFFRHVLGVDEPWTNALACARGAVGTALFAFAVAARDVARGSERARGRRLSLAAGGAFVAALAVRGLTQPWVLDGPQLPLLAAGTFALAVRARARASGEEQRAELGALAAWALFSLLLLGKMLLRSGPAHYGFALALPAMLLVVALLVGALPRALERRGKGGPLARELLVALVLLDVGHSLRISNESYRHMTATLGSGGDRIRVHDPRVDATGAGVARVVERLEGLGLAPADRVLVLPEGAGIDYLVRRRSGLRFTNFMPPELAIFGEDAIARELARALPEVVVLIDRDLAPAGHPGLPPFGADERYGKRIVDVVRERYVAEERIELGGPTDPPERRFGATLLRRKAP